MKVPEFLPLKVDQLPFRWGRVVQSVYLAQETRGLGFDTVRPLIFISPGVGCRCCCCCCCIVVLRPR